MALCHNGTLGRLDSLCCSNATCIWRLYGEQNGNDEDVEDGEDGGGGEDDIGFDNSGLLLEPLCSYFEG